VCVKSLRDQITLRTCDCDVSGLWRPSAIMTEMQEIATRHSDAIGCGRRVLLKENLAWVVARCHIEMDRYPAVGETLNIETFHMPCRHRFFPRYFTFTGADGQPVGKAATLWLLMDLESRQSVAGTEVARRMPDNRDLVPPLPLPSSVPSLSGEPERGQILPQYADLDLNGHVNNTRYADWLCNALGTDVMKKHRITSLTLQYNAEVLPEQPVHLETVRSGNAFWFTIRHGEQLCFEAGGTLSPCV